MLWVLRLLINECSEIVVAGVQSNSSQNEF
jgi:hypothetical protein